MPNKEKATKISTVSKKRKVDALISWKIKDFEENKKSFRFFLYFYSILFGITVYGLITDNLLLSILIILFGFTFFLFEKKQPQTITFAVTKEGIFIHDHIRPYDSLESFWIEYEPEGTQEISFKNNQLFLPYIKIPLIKTDPVKLRKCLTKFIPEKEHRHNLDDFLEKF